VGGDERDDEYHLERLKALEERLRAQLEEPTDEEAVRAVAWLRRPQRAFRPPEPRRFPRRADDA
jgi:hypothetical protein